jgi:hypothetical protein
MLPLDLPMVYLTAILTKPTFHLSNLCWWATFTFNCDHHGSQHPARALAIAEPDRRYE